MVIFIFTSLYHFLSVDLQSNPYYISIFYAFLGSKRAPTIAHFATPPPSVRHMYPEASPTDFLPPNSYHPYLPAYHNVYPTGNLTHFQYPRTYPQPYVHGPQQMSPYHYPHGYFSQQPYPHYIPPVANTPINHPMASYPEGYPYPQGAQHSPQPYPHYIPPAANTPISHPMASYPEGYPYPQGAQPSHQN
jgi:hypothetical protein